MKRFCFTLITHIFLEFTTRADPIHLYEDIRLVLIYGNQNYF